MEAKITKKNKDRQKMRKRRRWIDNRKEKLLKMNTHRNKKTENRINRREKEKIRNEKLRSNSQRREDERM